MPGVPEPKKWNACLRPILWGLGAACAVCAALLLGLAGLMTARDLPPNAIDPLTVLCAALACFGGGYLAARLARERGMLLGIVCAALAFLLLFLVSLPFDGGCVSFFTAVKLLSMLLAGAVGGVLGVNRRVRHR